MKTTSIYTFKPEESSIYVQDKIELNELIITLYVEFQDNKKLSVHTEQSLV